jgi:hypothetical protein
VADQDFPRAGLALTLCVFDGDEADDGLFAAGAKKGRSSKILADAYLLAFAANGGMKLLRLSEGWWRAGLRW